jgi:hypothetical protein
MIIARLVDGKALEPHDNASVEEYIARFNDFVVETWGDNPVVVHVCDGVQHCASYLGGDPLDPAQFINPDGSDGNGVFPEVTEVT